MAYDVSRDNQRSLMIKVGSDLGEAILVQNWSEELTRLAPVP